jgi:hypothetical protein
MCDDVNIPGTPLSEMAYLEFFTKPTHTYGVFTKSKFLGMNPELMILDEIQTFSTKKFSETSGEEDNS